MLYALWVFDTIREERQEPKIALSSTTPAVGRSDVRLDAWVNESHVSEGQALSFWVAIQNTSSDEKGTITAIEIAEFRSPGFTLPPQQVRAGCWNRGRPTCMNTRAPATRFASLRLKPRDARTIQGQVIAGSESGRYGLSMVVAWRDSAGVPRRKPISLGPIIVQHRSKGAGRIAAQAAQRFFKDLALPIIGAVLAYELSKRERQREKKQKDAAEHAARTQETYNLMMPKVHQNAERHYMPLCSTAENAARYFDEGKPDLVFYFYVVFLSTARRMRTEIGGLYLKNREAEDILKRIFGLIRDNADAVLTRELRERAEATAKPEMSSPDFARNHWQLAEARQKFEDRYAEFGGQAALLRLFSLLLEYEMNFVYDTWYGVPEAFPASEVAGVRKELESTLWREELQDFKRRLDDYLDKRRDPARGVQRSDDES